MNVNAMPSVLDGEPAARVLLSDAGPWILMAFGQDLSVYLPGYGPDCARYARQLADRLVAAALECDAETARRQPAPKENTGGQL